MRAGALAIVLVLTGAPVVRRAVADDGVCGAQVCPAGSPNEYKELPCSAPACECWNSCDGSSSSGGGDKGKGVALMLAVFITFPFVPLMNIEMLAGKGEPYAFGKPAEAKERWTKHRTEVRELERVGREADKELDRLRDAMASPPRKKQPARTPAKRYRPIAGQPIPIPPEARAQEACSQQYRRDYAANIGLAHVTYCACSADAVVCADGQTSCQADAIAKYKACLAATPKAPE